MADRSQVRSGDGTSLPLPSPPSTVYRAGSTNPTIDDRLPERIDRCGSISIANCDILEPSRPTSLIMPSTGGTGSLPQPSAYAYHRHRRPLDDETRSLADTTATAASSCGWSSSSSSDAIFGSSPRRRRRRTRRHVRRRPRVLSRGITRDDGTAAAAAASFRGGLAMDMFGGANEGGGGTGGVSGGGGVGKPESPLPPNLRDTMTTTTGRSINSNSSGIVTTTTTAATTSTAASKQMAAGGGGGGGGGHNRQVNFGSNGGSSGSGSIGRAIGPPRKAAVLTKSRKTLSALDSSGSDSSSSDSDEYDFGIGGNIGGNIGSGDDGITRRTTTVVIKKTKKGRRRFESAPPASTGNANAGDIQTGGNANANATTTNKNNHLPSTAVKSNDNDDEHRRRKKKRGVRRVTISGEEPSVSIIGYGGANDGNGGNSSSTAVGGGLIGGSGVSGGAGGGGGGGGGSGTAQATPKGNVASAASAGPPTSILRRRSSITGAATNTANTAGTIGGDTARNSIRSNRRIARGTSSSSGGAGAGRGPSSDSTKMKQQNHHHQQKQQQDVLRSTKKRLTFIAYDVVAAPTTSAASTSASASRSGPTSAKGRSTIARPAPPAAAASADVTASGGKDQESVAAADRASASRDHCDGEDEDDNGNSTMIHHHDDDDDDDDAAAFADDESEASSLAPSPPTRRRRVKSANTTSNDDDDDAMDAAEDNDKIKANDESSYRTPKPQSRGRAPSSSSRSTTTQQPRPKRPTPMDLAWRQVALDEAAGRLPPFVAETEADRKIERIGEKYGRDKEELARIRKLRDKDETAYWDALGVYLSGGKKPVVEEAEGGERGSDGAANNTNKRRRRRRRTEGTGSASNGNRADASDTSSSGVSGSSDGEEESEIEIEVDADLLAARNKPPVVLPSSSSDSSSSSDDDDEKSRVPPLGTTLAVKWRGQSELLSLAKEHQRFVIQYRATYHSATKSIRDGASKRTSDKIRRGDLIIKSRYADPSRGADDTVCSFDNWKLPGSSNSNSALMSSLKPVISESFRRGGLGGRRRGGTHNPPLFLDQSLSFEDKAKVRAFISDAKTGSTPAQHFPKPVGSSKKSYGQGRDRDEGARKRVDAEEDSESSSGSEDSALSASERKEDVADLDISAPSGSDDGFFPFDESGSDDGPPKKIRGQRKSNSRALAPLDEPEERNISTARADVEFNSLLHRGISEDAVGRAPSSRKKSHGSHHRTKSLATGKENEEPVAKDASKFTPRTRTARKKLKHEEMKEAPKGPPKRKTYKGTSRKKVCRPISFSCYEAPSEVGASSFALIEGVSGGISEEEEYVSGHPLDRANHLPFRGRTFELPGAVRNGQWSGELVQDSSQRVVSSAIVRDKVEDLRGIRISLRHKDVKTLGRLKDLIRSEPTMTFNIINPNHSRAQGFKSQVVLEESELEAIRKANKGKRVHGLDFPPFIGSISLAIFDGFDQIGDQNDCGADLADDFLDGCRDLAARATSSASHDLLPLCKFDSNEGNAGVSFPCKIQFNDEYWIIIAQDDANDAVVAVDILFDDPSSHSSYEPRLSLDSSSSTGGDNFYNEPQYPVPLTEENLEIHTRIEAESLERSALMKEEEAEKESNTESSSSGSGFEESRKESEIGEDSVLSSQSSFDEFSDGEESKGQGRYISRSFGAEELDVEDRRHKARTATTRSLSSDDEKKEDVAPLPLPAAGPTPTLRNVLQKLAEDSSDDASEEEHAEAEVKRLAGEAAAKRKAEEESASREAEAKRLAEEAVAKEAAAKRKAEEEKAARIIAEREAAAAAAKKANENAAARARAASKKKKADEEEAARIVAEREAAAAAAKKAEEDATARTRAAKKKKAEEEKAAKLVAERETAAALAKEAKENAAADTAAAMSDAASSAGTSVTESDADDPTADALPRERPRAGTFFRHIKISSEPNSYDGVSDMSIHTTESDYACPPTTDVPASLPPAAIEVETPTSTTPPRTKTNEASLRTGVGLIGSKVTALEEAEKEPSSSNVDLSTPLHQLPGGQTRDQGDSQDDVGGEKSSNIAIGQGSLVMDLEVVEEMCGKKVGHFPSPEKHSSVQATVDEPMNSPDHGALADIESGSERTACFLDGGGKDGAEEASSILPAELHVTPQGQCARGTELCTSAETVEYEMPSVPSSNSKSIPPPNFALRQPTSSALSEISVSPCDSFGRKSVASTESSVPPSSSRPQVSSPGGIIVGRSDDASVESTQQYFTPRKEDSSSQLPSPQYFFTPKDTNGNTEHRTISPEQLNLVVEAKSEEQPNPRRPSSCHSVIFGAQDVGSPLEGGDELRESENATIDEPDVLSTTPFFMEVRVSTDESPEDDGEAEEPGESEQESRSPPRRPWTCHSTIFGAQDVGTPAPGRDWRLTDRDEVIVKEPEILSSAPFFLESPGSAAEGEACLCRDARSIFFGAQDMDYSQTQEVEQLSSDDAAMVKEPGIILSRPLFLQSSSYDEDERYGFKANISLRSVIFGAGSPPEDETSGSAESMANTSTSMVQEPEIICLNPFFEASDSTDSKRPIKDRTCRRGGSLRNASSLLRITCLMNFLFWGVHTPRLPQLSPRRAPMTYLHERLQSPLRDETVPTETSSRYWFLAF